MKDYRNLREAVSHGTFLFPMEYYHCRMPEDFTVLPVHWHDEMEITRISQGAGRFSIDLCPYTAKAGDIILIPPGILHGITALPGQPMVSESFVFSLCMLGGNYPDSCSNQYLSPLLCQDMKSTPICRSDDSGYGKIEDAFLELLQIYRERGPYFELSLKSKLFHLFYLLYQYNMITPRKLPAGAPEVTDKIRAAILYIQENYGRPIAVAELADLCHFSTCHFMRFFKKHLNMTCVEYINHFRITMALKSLETTTLPVTTIALENGFNNVSYFNRQFKQAFHMTPSQYRQTRAKERI